MKKMYGIYMALFLAVVDCLGGCTSVLINENVLTESKPEQRESSPKPEFHSRVEVAIPITMGAAKGELMADIFRPKTKISPKTLIIIVPGSGNISRRGEVENNGIDIYPQAVETSFYWGEALSNQGLFVLSYDKRTCTSKQNGNCRINDQSDIDRDGIVALARDLDQVYEYAHGKLGSDAEGARIVLFSSTQGAQVVALSQSAKKAAGIVLLSPIVSDLKSMWIEGLKNAADQESSAGKKNRLLNQMESMSAFFDSLEKGQFPPTANIRGASVQFWNSWLSASRTTINNLISIGRPAVLLFSEKDRFSPTSLISNIKKQAERSRLQVRSMGGVDRNLIDGQSIPQAVVQQVMGFVSGLPAEQVANK